MKTTIRKNRLRVFGWHAGPQLKHVASLILALIVTFGTCNAGVVSQIDPYPLSGTRKIPDIQGSASDSVSLASDDVIDILILGDGYYASEESDFFNDAANYYDEIFDSEHGIAPYSDFSPAFRVRALFEASTARADTARDSYYRCQMTDEGKFETGEWVFGTTADDLVFRERVFAKIDELATPKNLKIYSSNIVNAVDGIQTIDEMANRYRNFYIIMLARNSKNNNPSGFSKPVKKIGEEVWVRTGFGASVPHEFSHTFGYIKDEYIWKRDTTAAKTNPASGDLSVFNLSNLWYSNDRCDMPWRHIAPGGKYNPNLYSFIGNYYKGGWEEEGSWHSEYACLINGSHQNYACSVDEPYDDSNKVSLRDNQNLCIWCREIVAMRILERTGQLSRSSDPPNVNEKGRTWFDYWKSTLRDGYYNKFDLETAIAQRDSCYMGLSPSIGCSLPSIPTCLSDCDIRDVGIGIYVNSSTGSSSGTGKKTDPVNDIETAVALAQTECGSLPVVILNSVANYGGVDIILPVTIITDRCVGVSIQP